jgi:hypothetical protein
VVLVEQLGLVWRKVECVEPPPEVVRGEKLAATAMSLSGG